MLRNTTKLSLIFLCLNLVFWVCVCENEIRQNQQLQEEQAAAIFQNMLSYFNARSFADKSGNPSQAFRDILSESQDTSQGRFLSTSSNPARNNPNIVAPVANNPMVQPVAAIPVHVAAAKPPVAFIHAAAAHVPQPASEVQDIGVNIATEPIAPISREVVPAAVAPVAPAAPFIQEAAAPVVPVMPAVKEESAPIQEAAAPVVPAVIKEADIAEAAQPKVVAAAITPITTIPVPPPQPTQQPTVSLVPVPTVVTTKTPVPTIVPTTLRPTTSPVNTMSPFPTTLHNRTTSVTSFTRTTATPSATTTIPAISAGVSYFDISLINKFTFAIGGALAAFFIFMI